MYNYEQFAKEIEKKDRGIFIPIRYAMECVWIGLNSKTIKANIDEFIDKFYGDSDKSLKKKILKDCLWFCREYGHGIDCIDNYFKFQFFEKSKRERANYSIETMHRKNSLCYDWGYFNQYDYYRFFDDKGLFDATFKDYLKRPFIIVNEETSYQQFKMFCEMSNGIFCKPEHGLLGRGCFKEDNKDEQSIQKAWEKIQSYKDSYIVEEVVRGNDIIASYHPASINTIRIVSLVRGKDVLILGAYQRFGNGGACTDHSNVGAISALIDTETGVVCTQAVDKYNHRYTYHPYSNKVIPGLCLPNWEACIEFVKKLAMVVPQVRLVGWDIAINDKGEWIVIEGNHNCGYEVIQLLDGGKQSLLREIFNDERTR